MTRVIDQADDQNQLDPYARLEKQTLATRRKHNIRSERNVALHRAPDGEGWTIGPRVPRENHGFVHADLKAMPNETSNEKLTDYHSFVPPTPRQLTPDSAAFGGLASLPAGYEDAQLRAGMRLKQLSIEVRILLVVAGEVDPATAFQQRLDCAGQVQGA